MNTNEKTIANDNIDPEQAMNARDLKILFLEDNEFDYDLIRRELLRSSLVFTSVLSRNREEFVQALESFLPDIVLSDHTLPQFDSLSALEIVKEKYAHIPFILVTGSVSEEFAVQCIKNGAEDYILKSKLTRLASSIRGALNKKELMSENRIIRRLNEELRDTYHVLAQKNRDITNSIRYAEKIQTAMLPESALLHRFFSESFILNRPRDIISGDFYWMAELKDKLLFAVGDCTGHGVPGALLSITAYHLLNEIVHLRNVTTPSGVLMELNKSIQGIFNPESKKDALRDGMDIAFCSFRKTENILEFAGARRPLYVLDGKEISEYKGSLLSIGGIHHREVGYDSREIKLNPGDRLYLFTDGYTDQFGGKEDKKINTRGFRQLLENTRTFSMPTQKKFLNGYIEEWKQQNEQTDDILVLGIQV